MATTKTCKEVLADISTMKTLVEKFPMSLFDGLDLNTEGPYSSVFDFLMDVLKSCGLTTDELIKWLIVKVFGVKEKSKDELWDETSGFLSDKSFEEFEQSTFLNTLEYGIKEVLMGLLTSLYSCSALPILPNQVFDSSNLSGVTGVLMNQEYNIPQKVKLKDLIDNRVFDGRPEFPLRIPVRLIDKTGMLNINPVSEEGLLYYAVEGRNKYYHKEEVEKDIPIETSAKTSGVKEVISEVPKYAQNVSIKIAKASAQNSHRWYFTLSDVVDADLRIHIYYEPPIYKAPLVEKEVTIKAGELDSEEFEMHPFTQNDVSSTVNFRIYTWIKKLYVNDDSKFTEIGTGSSTTERTRVFFDSEGVEEVVGEDWFKNGWENSDLFLGPGSEVNAETIPKITKEEKQEGEVYTKNEKKKVLEYVECDRNAIPSGETFTRVSAIPSYKSTTEEDPEYIVCYDGLMPQTLYQTRDMNAFIWYVLNMGSKTPYIEYNHMMWDSRLLAKDTKTDRQTPRDWNKWYESKALDSTPGLKFPDGEFSLYGQQPDNLYPILQMEAEGKGVLKLHMPAQRYFAPGIRKRVIDGKTITRRMPYLNASVYKFDWDYLQSIRILHPKLLLVKMCEYLLGFSLSTNDMLNVTLTKSIIQGKLSKAIKNIVEANDMEVEDCYFTFTNDEFNQMMEETLLSKYNATYYGGENSIVRTHDINSYLSSIDKVNATATPEGSVEAIQKLVTDVTVDPGTESTIDYGVKANFDGNILKELLWSITEPIAEALFTPQVMLLLYINFNLTGMVKSSDFFGIDAGKLINVMLNKLLGLLKSIIIFVKNIIITELLKLFKETIAIILLMWEGLKMMEQLKAWRKLLEQAASCISGVASLFNGRNNGIQNGIDDVDYADIITEETQDIPETSSEC